MHTSAGRRRRNKTETENFVGRRLVTRASAAAADVFLLHGIGFFSLGLGVEGFETGCVAQHRAAQEHSKHGATASTLHTARPYRLLIGIKRLFTCAHTRQHCFGASFGQKGRSARLEVRCHRADAGLGGCLSWPAPAHWNGYITVFGGGGARRGVDETRRRPNKVQWCGRLVGSGYFWPCDRACVR